MHCGERAAGSARANPLEFVFYIQDAPPGPHARYHQTNQVRVPRDPSQPFLKTLELVLRKAERSLGIQGTKTCAFFFRAELSSNRGAGAPGLTRPRKPRKFLTYPVDGICTRPRTRACEFARLGNSHRATRRRSARAAAAGRNAKVRGLGVVNSSSSFRVSLGRGRFTTSRGRSFTRPIHPFDDASILPAGPSNWL